MKNAVKMFDMLFLRRSAVVFTLKAPYVSGFDWFRISISAIPELLYKQTREMGLSTVNCNCDWIEKGDAAQFGVILFPCVKRPSLCSEDDDDSEFQSN